ncbi:hypothetical protein PIPA1_32210 [Pelosinus sp. IPA-1]|nr:hypothetical protein PIPA1_32210 [Pelosinus sp. IPA-1]
MQDWCPSVARLQPSRGHGEATIAAAQIRHKREGTVQIVRAMVDTDVAVIKAQDDFIGVRMLSTRRRKVSSMPMTQSLRRYEK